MLVSRNKALLRGNFAASAALLVLLGTLAPPANAASTAQLPCPASDAATLNVQVDQLAATLVSLNTAAAAVTDDDTDDSNISTSQHLLAPLAEAAIKDAFERSEAVVTSSKPDVSAEDHKETNSDSDMNTRLPGISDAEFSRYKKQMYRRDI